MLVMNQQNIVTLRGRRNYPVSTQSQSACTPIKNLIERAEIRATHFGQLKLTVGPSKQQQVMIFMKISPCVQTYECNYNIFGTAFSKDESAQQL